MGAAQNHRRPLRIIRRITAGATTKGGYRLNYTSQPGRKLAAATAATLTVALSLIPAAAGTQSAPQSPQSQAPQAEQTLRVQVSIVNLFATVRDKNRRRIPDLEKGDFRILEDGAEQKIEFFERETALPITLGIVMDTSGSMYSIFSAEQEAATRFLNRVMREKDLAMVMTFDQDVDLLADFTNDLERLERAIMRAQVNAPGAAATRNYPGTPPTIPQRSRGTNLYDAIYLGCNEQLRREAGRKALVLLTDAADTGSKMSLSQALESAQRTDTVLHVIYISARDGFGFNEGDWGVAKKLAEETGGRAISVRNDKDLEKAFDELSEELRTQYTIGYYPSNTSRDGGYRKIKVETPKKDLKILARKGYYAPKS